MQVIYWSTRMVRDGTALMTTGPSIKRMVDIARERLNLSALLADILSSEQLVAEPINLSSCSF